MLVSAVPTQWTNCYVSDYWWYIATLRYYQNVIKDLAAGKAGCHILPV